MKPRIIAQFRLNFACFLTAISLVSLSACTSMESPFPDEITAPQADAHSHQAPVDALTLYQEMEFIVKKLNWATLESEDEITSFYYRALTPADEVVTITAQNNARGGSSFQIKVGIYGNSNKEDAFRQVLANHLAEHSLTQDSKTK